MTIKENKILIFILVVVALTFLAFFVYQYKTKEKEFSLITNDKELADFMMNMKEGDREAYLAWRDKQYAKDIYGGDTPEETLEMYIKALKAGDMELASKYFRLEDQKKRLSELNKLDENQIKISIAVLETHGSPFCNEILGWCKIRGYYKGKDAIIASFIQNQQTKKWKMESL